jgi:hypothetical protein
MHDLGRLSRKAKALNVGRDMEGFLSLVVPREFPHMTVDEYVAVEDVENLQDSLVV